MGFWYAFWPHKIISQVFHFLTGKVINFGFFLIDFQLHVPRKVVCNAIFEPHSVIIILTQHQDIISISNMNPNFQICFCEVAPLVCIVVEFSNAFVMPTITLVT